MKSEVTEGENIKQGVKNNTWRNNHIWGSVGGAVGELSTLLHNTSLPNPTIIKTCQFPLLSPASVYFSQPHYRKNYVTYTCTATS